MVKEEKRGKPSQKIMPFPTATEEKLEGLEDAEMDQFLRESVKKEADEIEKALNEDPKLIGVGASDDLFEKIVAELKERGEWEEEEAGEAGLEGDREEDKQEKRQKEQENRQGKGQQEQGEGQEDQKEQKEGREKLEDQKEGQKEQVEGQEEREGQKEQEEGREEKKGQEKQENKQEEKLPEGRGSEEEIYKLLSEEDRDALEYGRRMKKEKEIREQRKKHRRKRWQRAGVTAAALALVMGVGLRSEANRRFVLQVWESMTNNFGTRMPVNFVEQDELHIESDEEQEAFAEIEKRLNVAPIYFGYLPEGMVYEHYTINENAAYAIVSYSYQDVFWDIYLRSGEDVKAGYYQVDGNEEEVETVVNEQGIESEMCTVIMDEDTYCTATFSNGESYYYCCGMIPIDEMKKILKFFLISD